MLADLSVGVGDLCAHLRGLRGGFFGRHDDEREGKIPCCLDCRGTALICAVRENEVEKSACFWFVYIERCEGGGEKGSGASGRALRSQRLAFTCLRGHRFLAFQYAIPFM